MNKVLSCVFAGSMLFTVMLVNVGCGSDDCPTCPGATVIDSTVDPLGDWEITETGVSSTVTPSGATGCDSSPEVSSVVRFTSLLGNQLCQLRVQDPTECDEPVQCKGTYVGNSYTEESMQVSTWRSCFGGDRDGQPCDFPADCPNGTCGDCTRTERVSVSAVLTSNSISADRIETTEIAPAGCGAYESCVRKGTIEGMRCSGDCWPCP